MTKWIVRTSDGVTCTEEGSRASMKDGWVKIFDNQGKPLVAFFQPILVRRLPEVTSNEEDQTNDPEITEAAPRAQTAQSRDNVAEEACHSCGGQGLDTDTSGPTRGCPDCKGTGRQLAEPCWRCHGQRKVRDHSQDHTGNAVARYKGCPKCNPSPAD